MSPAGVAERFTCRHIISQYMDQKGSASMLTSWVNLRVTHARKQTKDTDIFLKMSSFRDVPKSIFAPGWWGFTASNDCNYDKKCTVNIVITDVSMTSQNVHLKRIICNSNYYYVFTTRIRRIMFSICTPSGGGGTPIWLMEVPQGSPPNWNWMGGTPPPRWDWMGLLPPSRDREAERALVTQRAVCLLPSLRRTFLSFLWTHFLKEYYQLKHNRQQ